MGSTPSSRVALRMSRRSVTVKDVPADEFIKACADYLKRQPKFDVPKFHDIVKTGVHKELAPYDEDWFYIRAASVARKVYLRSGTGVGALKKWYGGSNSAHPVPRRLTSPRLVVRSFARPWLSSPSSTSWITPLMVAVSSPPRAVLSSTALPETLTSPSMISSTNLRALGTFCD